jgi:ABC-type dipeptide/oligopeptide/nickel transport system permease component
MLFYVLRRLLSLLLVLWAAATLTFFAVHLAPGDPATAQLARAGAPASAIEARRDAMGLNDPLEMQYGRFLTGLLHGNLGRSWHSNQQVSQTIATALPATLSLATAAVGVAVTLGLVLGTLSALARHRGWTALDSGLMTLALSGVSTPVAFSGLAAILIFSVALNWLPSTGQGDLQHLFLPALVLGWSTSGSLARLTRDRVLYVLDQRFIVAARARGIPSPRILWRHTARAALPEVLTLLAMQIGFLLGGTVITESVFARRGLGRVAVEAVLNQDLPVVQGVVLLAAVVYTLANLAADAMQLWLDPRLREGSSWR